MPIDPTGTQPGLPTAQDSRKKVGIKCRVQGCDSIEAFEVSLGASQGERGAPSQRVYQCCKCSTTWGLTVGGHFAF